MAHWMHRTLLALLAVTMLVSNACAAGPSRISMDFSSSLIVSPDSTPASVSSRMDALLQDMAQDGVNNLCNGRLAKHVCGTASSTPEATKTSFFLPLLNWFSHKSPVVQESSSSSTDGCTLCLQAAVADDTAVCSCAAPGGTTRCSCSGKLTGQQYFSSKWSGLELARVAVEAVGETRTINSDIQANFNSTIRLRDSKLFVTKGASTDSATPGVHDLELDESHLDLMQGSELHIEDDGDMEVEDAGTLWLSGNSKLIAKQASNIQIQLSHVLVEGGSSINIEASSEMNMTQEFDLTPAQAAAICNQAFQPDPAGEACFKDPASCKPRLAANKLSSNEHQALEMLKYPPALDKWGRQAFDYAGDDAQDDYYDSDYTEVQLDAGTCLAADACGTDPTTAVAAAAPAPTGNRRLLLAAAPAPVPAPEPAESDDKDEPKESTNGKAAAAPAPAEPADDDADEQSATASTTAAAATTAATAAAPKGPTTVTAAAAPAAAEAPEINKKDTLDGTGYDPEWGEGPNGETLCDAPPFRAFNYYGFVVRDNSHVRIAANSTWTLMDQSRVFFKDSTLTLEDGARLQLFNSTIVLINSVLVIKGSSEIHMERFSGLHLFQSKVLGDNALFGVPAGSTWQGQPWVQTGDYRAMPSGWLPASMGVQPGVQLGTYPMRVFGFDLDARLMPAAGCNCKKPRAAGNPASADITTVPSSGNLLENLI